VSAAIRILHGSFGRATLFHLDRALIAHAHREGHLLFHLSGASGRVTVDGHEYELSSEMAVAINPWQVHSYAPEVTSGQYLLVLYIRPNWFNDIPQFTREGLYIGRNSFPMTAEVRQMVGRITELLSEDENSQAFDDQLRQLAGACFRLTREDVALPLMSGTRAPCSDFRIRRSLALMGNRFDVNLDLARVSAAAGLSRSHFFKLFQSQLGVTPRTFWNTLRLERAFHELVETDRTISDISLDLGFSSQSAFSRFFALNTGLAPTHYRRVGYVIRA
jgi:AraC-like DNA-binding protein